MSESAQVEDPVGPVVVGCDGSWPGGQAVIVAATAARRRGMPLKLLVVERPPDTATEGRSGAAEHARYVGRTARMQALSAEPGVVTEVILVSDVRDARVVQLASQAGLLVLGSYGAGGQVALSLGSTSEALARAFRCPLLLPHARVGESLRAGTRPPTVLAAISHDDSARHVVSAAAREAAERRVPLLIVHALSMHDAAEFASEQDWVATLVAAVEIPSWLPHRTVVTVADPVAAVLDRVEPDDLVVVATRGEGRLAGLVSGSVTRALLDAGQCDVLVLSHSGVSHGAAHRISGMESHPAQGGIPDATKLSATECWSLLRSAAVGRLGVSVDGRQDIFPVNHVVSRESVVFRTAQGSKLDAAVDHPVAFEVDGFDSATGDAWSVVVKGTARELRDRDEIIRALRLPITPWPGGLKPRIVQIDPYPDSGAVTGRRFHVFGGLTAVTSSAREGWLAAPSPDLVPAHH
ncbi:MAG: pyridoxamine 5'-phosphate oxidase family protein [Actinomycetota bacterium]|nr:pyridoxamine 5'-phosphate oxidase family protein [Actinomycetota bacterium]